MYKKKSVCDCPLLLKHWHPLKNTEFTPENISFKSSKKIWWLCEKGHEWTATCNDKRSCPYCKNVKVCKDNCLAAIFPEIAKEWHPTRNNGLTPWDVVAGTHRKVWWVCDKNHVWDMKCCERTGSSKYNCPYCRNLRVCESNCLATMFPEIAKEWHPTKNVLTAFDIIAGSSKKVWWKCKNGCEYLQASVLRINGHGCPNCIESKGENIIRDYLDKNGIDFKPQYVFKNTEIEKYRFDFRTSNFLIEYHGRQHYCPSSFGSKKKYIEYKNFYNTVKCDLKKVLWCEKNNISLLVIPFWEQDRISEILDHYIKYKTSCFMLPIPKKVLYFEKLKKIFTRYSFKNNESLFEPHCVKAVLES
jgi:hypothetical protein